MTIPIERANIRIENVTDEYSRYRDSKVIYYGVKRLIAFETYLRQPYQVTGEESILLIKKTIEYRPDLVSYDVYGVPDYWWKILEVNNMKDVWDFKAGVTIKLPSVF